MPPTRARHRALPLLLLALVLATALMGGCARVRTALAVQPDDTVTGEVVIATPQKAPEDKGPAVTLPPELTGDVDVATYSQDGYVGSVLRFSRLRFDEVTSLAKALGPTGSRVDMQLRRTGGRVLLGGTVDLNSVSVDKADFQLKISFPGNVVTTNGDLDGSTISWTFTPGEVGTVEAAVSYADPNAPSALNWTLGLAGGVLLAALVVVIIARRTRNPPIRR